MLTGIFPFRYGIALEGFDIREVHLQLLLAIFSLRKNVSPMESNGLFWLLVQGFPRRQALVRTQGRLLEFCLSSCPSRIPFVRDLCLERLI